MLKAVGVEFQTEGITMSQVKGFFSGLLVGGLVGAGLMLLFAPKAGKKTRAQILHQYDDLRDQVVESLEDVDEEVTSKARHLASDARRKMKGMQHRGEALARKM